MGALKHFSLKCMSNHVASGWGVGENIHLLSWVRTLTWRLWMFDSFENRGISLALYMDLGV